jgi:hypothetical protein
MVPIPGFTPDPGWEYYPYRTGASFTHWVWDPHNRKGYWYSSTTGLTGTSALTLSDGWGEKVPCPGLDQDLLVDIGL